MFRALVRPLLILCTFEILDACIRTVPTPSPGTTCTCTAAQITFTPAQANRAGSIDSSFTGPSADGCSLTAQCLGDPGMVAFMQFNTNQGGPAENAAMTQNVEAPLECRNGQWFYRDRQVNEVNCQQAANG
ncbi:unnamed protein product, partial [Mesorhabditis spiculigera]